MIRSLVAATISVLSACVLEEPTQPLADESILVPRSTADCTFSAQLCGDIQSSINHLTQHADAGCRMAGSAAQARFNAVGYGFRPPNFPVPPGAKGVVIMSPNSAGDPWTFSGWHAVDPNTYITDSGITQLTEVLAGTIAHEEWHHFGHDGPDHSMQTAQAIALTCQNG